MQFNRPVTEIIKERTSKRRYKRDIIEEEKRTLLEKVMKNSTLGPLGSKCRFELITVENGAQEALKGLGTYGFIKGATGFIVGAVHRTQKALEDYGYLMECIILKSTDLQLGTCWLGGSFTKTTFAKKIGLNDWEKLPAVAAIGYATEKRRLGDQLIRLSIRAKQRRPFESLFFSESFDTPLSFEKASSATTSLEMVRLAPSSGNSQPWRILRQYDSGQFHFFLDRTNSYKRTQKLFRFSDLPRIDMGIAMCHFELSQMENGITGKWQVLERNFEGLPSQMEYVVSWQEI